MSELKTGDRVEIKIVTGEIPGLGPAFEFLEGVYHDDLHPYVMVGHRAYYREEVLDIVAI